MSKKATNVTIAPSRSSNMATIVRAAVNEAHAHARNGSNAKLAECLSRFDEAVAEYKASLWAVCNQK